MAFLISFVNQLFTPELRLGIYFEEKDLFQWITSDIPWKSSGATGIATNNEDRIYACTQKSYNPGLIVYDYNFEIIQCFDFRKVKDPHSIAFYENKLYVVSSGTNEIVTLDLDESGCITEETIFWRMPNLEDYSVDRVHLNSIAVSSSGEFYTTCFGKQHPGGWGETLWGQLINISTGDVILENLHHPHTAYSMRDRILFCESKTGRLHDQDKAVCHIGGYVRGMSENDNFFIVASSARRKISKSRGIVLRGRAGDFEDPSLMNSRIAFIDKGTYKIIKEKDFTHYGREIFDILSLSEEKIGRINLSPNAMTARIASFEENCFENFRIMEETVAKRESAIQTLKTGIADREKIITERNSSIQSLRAEIADREKIMAERNSSIQRLKTEIADKDRIIAERNSSIQSLKTEIADKDRIIAERNSSIQSLSDSIADKDRIIAERNSSIQSLRNSIADKDRIIAERNSSIKSLKARIADGKGITQE